jgi:hypothetical protein
MSDMYDDDDREDYPGSHDNLPDGGPTDEELESKITRYDNSGVDMWKDMEDRAVNAFQREHPDSEPYKNHRNYRTGEPGNPPPNALPGHVSWQFWNSHGKFDGQSWGR